MSPSGPAVASPFQRRYMNENKKMKLDFIPFSERTEAFVGEIQMNVDEELD